MTLYKSDEKKIVVTQKPTVNTIALKKVVLKKKEVKKVVEKKEIKKVVTPKIVEKKVKKVVKKAKRKVPKKIVKKEVKKVEKKLEKKVEKMVKKITPKIIPTVVKKVIPSISKKTIVSNIDKNAIKNDYLSKLRATIENNKIYPKRAKRLKQQGKVIISFEITKSGHIKKIALKNACPYRRLNSAAIELLEQIAKFEPIPKELEKNTWAIDVPINYSIVNI
ncbi:energy transducer TonB [Arcobacter sp. LA11]|uniref:energy transducer TonB n=1 Tax=Arcobacter sp. LA11 TaxID=1898176 RepID=UPI0009339FB9|nr:energy transducer TonB [Arcobacter sp. LA11]